jgi:hypothetical protein
MAGSREAGTVADGLSATAWNVDRGGTGGTRVAPLGAATHPPTAPDRVSPFHSGSGTPVFAAPGLVLLATIAIFEGYHWLHLIPNGPVRPTAVVLAVLVAPASFGLTRRISGPGTGSVRIIARTCAVLVPALWVVLLLVHATALAGILGTVSLALALALVALAVLSEISGHRYTVNS